MEEWLNKKREFTPTVGLSPCYSLVPSPDKKNIRWRGVSGAWALSGAPLSVSLSGVCLCACLLSDRGMISDEGLDYLSSSRTPTRAFKCRGWRAPSR